MDRAVVRSLLLASVLLLPALLLGACKPNTLETRWPGPQEPSTESLLRFIDSGLPPPGTSEPEPPAPPPAAVAAAPPAADAPPPTAGPSVVVDMGALPPLPGTPATPGEPTTGPASVPPGALAALLGTVPPATAPDQPMAPPPAGQRVVALLLPLSGPTAGLGQAMLDAAMLATFDMAGDEFVLRPYDTAGTPEGAAAAAQRALGEGAQLILGPLFAAEARAVGPIAASANVNVLAFSNDRSVAGGDVNVMGFMPEAQVGRIVAYARAKQIERFAVIAPNNDYGNAVVNGLRAALDATGGQLADVALYEPGTDDLAPVVRNLAHYDGPRRGAIQALQGKNDAASKDALRKLQDQNAAELGFDALLVAESGSKLRSLASLLPYYDIDPSKVKILGAQGWDDPTLGTEPALLGAWYAAPPPEARADFEKRFETTFRRKPQRLASLAYDAAALAAVVARTTGFSADALHQPSGYAGVDGIFRLRPDGLIERGMAVVEVQQRGVKTIDPPPESFQSVN